MGFDVLADVTINRVYSPKFGLFMGGAAGRDFQLVARTGKITGSDRADYVSGAQRGEYQIYGDGNPNNIVVEITNIVMPADLSLTHFKCSYEGGSNKTCSGRTQAFSSPDAVTPSLLAVGLRVVTTQAVAQGSTSISFDLDVVYQ